MGLSINDVIHLRERGTCQKVTFYSISLFSKMGDKGEGGVKNLKKSVTLFMDGPFTMFRTRPSTIILNEWKVLKLLINAHFNYVLLRLRYQQYMYCVLYFYSFYVLAYYITLLCSFTHVPKYLCIKGWKWKNSGIRTP